MKQDEPKTIVRFRVDLVPVLANGIDVPIVADAADMPTYAHEGDAGADMRADIPEPVAIEPMRSAWVGTGVRVAIPDGFVGLQFPRSGLGCNHGICLANGTGVIDSGYRGEIRAKLLNLGPEPFTVNPGDRVCQLVVVPFARAEFVPAKELPGSDRGTDGYGSTGVR